MHKKGEVDQTAERLKAPNQAITPLGLMLISKGLIKKEQLDEALAIQQETSDLLGVVLLEKGWVKQDDVFACLREQIKQLKLVQTGIPIEKKKVSDVTVDSSAVPLLSLELALKTSTMPLDYDDRRKTLRIAILNSEDIETLDEIRFNTGYNLHPVEVTRQWLEEAWRVHYGHESERFVEKHSATIQAHFSAYTSRLTSEHITSFINHLLAKATELNASDIHLDPFADYVLIRLRIDGCLYEAARVDIDVYKTFINRLRIMANINVGERRGTFDSRLAIDLPSGLRVEFRISIINAQFGSQVVLRIQRGSAKAPLLTNIGLPLVFQKLIKRKVHNPHGLVVVTGPTGSGKTTTLYAMLAELSDLTRKVITIEDPIEQTVSGASQIAVNADRGHTFANILRTVLRQDPDIIMVGEIRDEETAQIAVRSALTGHLVLCSLHTNDALLSIERLTDMGVKPYLLGPALNLIIAQRLVRVLCDHCKQPAQVPNELLFDLGLTPEEILTADLCTPQGCLKCSMTGYRGRIPVFEILEVRHEIKTAVSGAASVDDIRAIAKRHRFTSLRVPLKEYLKRGKTSIEEAMDMLAY